MAAWDKDPIIDDLTITDKDLASVRRVESGGNDRAVSPKGAIGPYQFMPDTAKSLGLSAEDAMDEKKARPAAKRYLQELTNKYGSKEKGLAAYNWGEGNMDKKGYDKAPGETQAYVKKVSAGAKPKWASDPIVGQEEAADSNLVASMNPRQPHPAVDLMARAAGNTASFADMIIGLPGMAVGSAIDLGYRIKGAVTGQDKRAAIEEGKRAAEPFAGPKVFSGAVDKMMRLAGYGENGEYSTSDVDMVMGKVSGAIAMGGEWVEKQTHGLLLKEDVESLTNEAMALGGVHGMKAGGKAIAKSVAKDSSVKPSPLPEVAKVREDPTSDKPIVKAPNLPPEARAKADIEQTMGIKDPVAREKVNAQNREDARAAFKDDPQYADYLKNYADEEVRQRSVAAKQADVIENSFTKINPEAADAVGKQQVTWNQALPIYKTPGFERTPEQLIRLRQFERQGGGVDPKLMVYGAAIGLSVAGGFALDPAHPIEGAMMGLAVAAGARKGIKGALKGAGVAAGIYLNPDNPIAGAALGAAGVATAMYVPKVAIEMGKAVWAAKSIQAAFKADPRYRMTDIGNAHEVAIERAARSIWQQQSGVLDLVPAAERRVAMTKWLQGDKSVPLTNAEYTAALKAKEFFAEMGKAGQESGVLGNLIDDYVTNLWDLDGVNKATFNSLTNNMSPNSRFNIQRTITSIEEGKKMGLKPVTEDVATIMGIYGNSLAKTMANRQLIESLKAATIDGSDASLMMPTATAPKAYVNGAAIHPQLVGNSIHPDIVPSLRFLFTQKNPSGIMAGIEMANTAYKRMAVSFSLFHAKALTDAYIGAGGNPLKLGKMSMGTSDYLKMVRKGGAGDLVDDALLGGLKFSYEKGKLADEDVRGNFYGGLEKMHEMANNIVPGSGIAIKGIEKLNLASDTLMWNRLHAGMKLEIFGKSMESLRENNAKAHAKNPNEVPLKSREELAKIASSYTNDIFGGLNWRRIAEESHTKWGRDLKMEVMSPKGRKVMQLALFAPDWTISTTRAAIKAFTGQGSGIKGIFKPQEIADLHRQYLVRSALYYFTVGNALNYAMSGHFIWDNKDPTMLELGDGRTMQFSKHMMEPVHWVTKPLQQSANKLGIIPKEFINQVTSKEYISTSGHAPPMGDKLGKTSGITATDRLKHAAKQVLPISSQGDMGAEARMAGMLGFPIYGQTNAEKAAKKEQQKLNRAIKLKKLPGE